MVENALALTDECRAALLDISAQTARVAYIATAMPHVPAARHHVSELAAAIKARLLRVEEILVALEADDTPMTPPPSKPKRNKAAAALPPEPGVPQDDDDAN